MPWSPDNITIGEFEDLPVQMLPRSFYFVPADETPAASPIESVATPPCPAPITAAAETVPDVAIATPPPLLPSAEAAHTELHVAPDLARSSEGLAVRIVLTDPDDWDGDSLTTTAPIAEPTVASVPMIILTDPDADDESDAAPSSPCPNAIPPSFSEPPDITIPQPNVGNTNPCSGVSPIGTSFAKPDVLTSGGVGYPRGIISGIIDPLFPHHHAIPITTRDHSTLPFAPQRRGLGFLSPSPCGRRGRGMRASTQHAPPSSQPPPPHHPY